MAYSLGDRFSKPTKCNMLLDPGAYQISGDRVIKPNKVPFLSKTPRNTQSGLRVWTDSIYNTDLPRKIINCTSLKSKCPRFCYEGLTNKDLEEFICRCGLDNTCECPTEDILEEQEEEIPCQAKLRKRIFKGLPPRCSLGNGLSAPSKRDRGFIIFPDGSQGRVLEFEEEECPPFYDTRVKEYSAFYHGCKWSRWTSKRTSKSLEVKPGPADYSIERKVTESEICAEKIRSIKRKGSKQLRFIEMIQEKNIKDGCPGPASYSPVLPKGTNLQFIGAKSERFPLSKYDMRPGPMSHMIGRDFDVPELPDRLCHAKLPQPACFGTKASRFRPRREEGPSPVSYCPTYKPCQFMHCVTTPFGSSAKRFQEKDNLECMNGGDLDELSDIRTNTELNKNHACPPLTSSFKSKLPRFKPLIKKWHEPSPSDLPMSFIKVDRSPYSQYNAPFNSSEGRLRPWYGYLAVFGTLNSPGPGYYNLEKHKCLQAVHRGPLFRAPRFAYSRSYTPAPNAYTVGGGVDTNLASHNLRLKKNVNKRQQSFHWKPPVESIKLNVEEKQTYLLNKCIDLLDYEEELCMLEGKPYVKQQSPQKILEESEKPKLLRCFLYDNYIPKYF